MKNWFKSKSSQKIIWDYIPERPSNVTFGVNSGKDLSDFLVPLIETMPDWFTSLRQTKDYLKQFPNVRTCPSFIELFKNSYAFIAPCDLQINISTRGFELIQTDEGWISMSSHTALPKEMGGNQMGDKWDPMIQNIKLMSGLQIGCNKGNFNYMYLPAYYHNPRARFTAPPGISTIVSSNPLDLNLNLFIDVTDIQTKGKEELKIKNGTVLAYVYFPSGILPFEKGKLNKKMRKSFLGDYNRHLDEYKKNSTKGKCPFSFLH